MQLSPSSLPLDPNVLALLLPAAPAPSAAPNGYAGSAAPAGEVSFEQLLSPPPAPELPAADPTGPAALAVGGDQGSVLLHRSVATAATGEPALHVPRFVSPRSAPVGAPCAEPQAGKQAAGPAEKRAKPALPAAPADGESQLDPLAAGPDEAPIRAEFSPELLADAPAFVALFAPGLAPVEPTPASEHDLSPRSEYLDGASASPARASQSDPWPAAGRTRATRESAADAVQADSIGTPATAKSADMANAARAARPASSASDGAPARSPAGAASMFAGAETAFTPDGHPAWRRDPVVSTSPSPLTPATSAPSGRELLSGARAMAVPPGTPAPAAIERLAAAGTLLVEGAPAVQRGEFVPVPTSEVLPLEPQHPHASTAEWASMARELLRPAAAATPVPLPAGEATSRISPLEFVSPLARPEEASSPHWRMSLPVVRLETPASPVSRPAPAAPAPAAEGVEIASRAVALPMPTSTPNTVRSAAEPMIASTAGGAEWSAFAVAPGRGAAGRNPAIFAGRSEPTADATPAGSGPGEKTFVSVETERLTPRSPALGIGVAQRTLPMPTPDSTLPTPHPRVEYASAAVASIEGTATGLAESSAGPAPAPAPAAGSAQVAVETVLRAVEHVASRQQHAVNLHFTVGDSELRVRVQLQAEEVRTTFSTDSSELRAALAQEWRAVVHGGGEGSFRVAPATFTSADSFSSGGHSSSFTSDADARERQPQPAPVQDFGALFASRRSPAGAAPTASLSEPAIPTRSLPAGARHLHTLA